MISCILNLTQTPEEFIEKNDKIKNNIELIHWNILENIESATRLLNEEIYNPCRGNFGIKIACF